MLHNFRGQMDFQPISHFTVDMDGVINRRQAVWRKFNVDNRADDLYYFTSHLVFPPLALLQSFRSANDFVNFTSNACLTSFIV